MDGNGRRIVTYNRIISAREIVRSNENYGERNDFDVGNPSDSNERRRSSNNQTIDGGTGTNYSGQYDRYDFGGPPTRNESRQLQPNPVMYGGHSSQYDHGRYEGRACFDFGGPVNPNEFRRIQSFNDPAIYGGPSSEYVGRNAYVGNPPNSNERHQGRSSNNRTIDGGTGTNYKEYVERNNFNVPLRATELRQFQTSNNPIMYEGLNNQYDMYEGRTNYDFGGPSTPNEHRQNLSNNNPVMYVGHNSQNNRYEGRANFDSGGPSNRNEFHHLQSSDERTKDGRVNPENHEISIPKNPEIKHLSDATSRIEHGKLKMRLIDAYKDKAKKRFSENSADFDKDDWLKVWYIGSDGLKMYQSKVICPLCFKNVTPFNRAEPGSLPRWDLNGVKGHLERLHSEKKVVKKGAEKEGDQKTSEEAPKTGEEEVPKTGEEDAPKTTEDDPSVGKDSGQNEPINKSSDAISPPESPSLSSSDSSSDSSTESSSGSISDASSESSDVAQTPVSTSKKRRRSSGTKKPPRTTRKREKLLSNSEIPEWRKPGVEFGWAKFLTSSGFVPAFIFPLEKNKKKRMARQILSKGGVLDDEKHEVDTIANESQEKRAKASKKSKPYVAAIKKFNLINNTKFE